MQLGNISALPFLELTERSYEKGNESSMFQLVVIACITLSQKSH